METCKYCGKENPSLEEVCLTCWELKLAIKESLATGREHTLRQILFDNHFLLVKFINRDDVIHLNTLPGMN